MAFYDKFPYTNFQELNLDWLTQEVSKVRDNRDASAASAAAALTSEQSAKASETAAANSATAASESQQAAANSETEAANHAATVLAQVGRTNARLDNIIASGDPTEGNTELIDIRLGYNNKKYSTAGTAVRSQVQDLHNGLNDGSLLIGSKPADLNDAANNHICRYTSTAANNPDGQEGTVITYKPSEDTGFQIAVSTSNNMFFRRLYISWRPWVLLLDMTAAKINDLNDAANNHICRYTSTAANNPDGQEGTVITYKPSEDIGFQIAVSTSNNMFFRRLYSSWRPWVLLKKVDSEYPFDVSPANISTVQSLGVVGDSYASGEIRLNDEWHDIIAQSWPQIIAREKGISTQNFSQGGMTAINFLSNTRAGLPRLLSSPKCRLYLLVLGINDDKTDAGIGTSADIGTDALTFYGAYSKIISQILAYSPHSKIICVKTASNNGSYAKLNTAIDTIARRYSIPVMAEYDDAFFQSAYYLNTMRNGHPNPSSYGGMANALARMVEVCMAKNWQYFYDINFYDL